MLKFLLYTTLTITSKILALFSFYINDLFHAEIYSMLSTDPIFGGPKISCILVHSFTLPPERNRPPKDHIKHINKHWYDQTV